MGATESFVLVFIKFTFYGTLAMEKGTKKDKSSEKDTLSNVIVLILGVLIFLVGTLEFYWELAGSRWGVAIEGIGAQIFGLIFVVIGLYIIISVIRKLRKINRK